LLENIKAFYWIPRDEVTRPARTVQRSPKRKLCSSPKVMHPKEGLNIKGRQMIISLHKVLAGKSLHRRQGGAWDGRGSKVTARTTATTTTTTNACTQR